MRTLIQTLFFFLLVTQIGFTQWKVPNSKSASDYSSQNISNDSFDIDSLITTTMTTYHIPGLSACIVRDGEIIWTGTYGYADIQNN